MTGARFPHSDTPGSTLRCQLPRAYRRLVRPSSALDAKASTMRPSKLVTQTPNNNHKHNPHTNTKNTNQHKKTGGQAHESPPGNNKPQKDQTHTPTIKGMHAHTLTHKHERKKLLTRCSRPLSNNQTPHPPTPPPPTTKQQQQERRPQKTPQPHPPTQQTKNQKGGETNA